MRYYVDEGRIRVYRMDGGMCETYNFPEERWMPDSELWDMFVGELWLDEITEDEAGSVIESRSAELREPASADRIRIPGNPVAGALR